MKISLTKMVIVLCMEAFTFCGCASDGSELFSTTEIKFVPYTGGVWKFEGGQRYYLKSVNNTDGAMWKIE